jgi:integrase
MPANTLQRKSNRGSVQVKVSHDRLQVVFWFGGKRHYLSAGFSDTPTNRKLAEMKALQIELDIVSGNFDPTLTKYKPASLAVKAPAPIVPKSPLNLELDLLWERYTEFKRPSLSPNTLDKEYATARRCIEQQFPTRSLDQAVLIRDWIVANKPIDAAKRLLTLLACCTWAQKSRLIAVNPFEGMSAEVKLPKNTSKNLFEKF